MGTLYLVATPIGNLEDITLRALRILREVALIAAEDTRHTRKLLTRYEIEQRVISYHEHNRMSRIDDILLALTNGDVALVSDAGTPAISDPGYELVQTVIAAGFPVVPIPGACAAITALVASGLPTDNFLFLGFPPRRATERRRWFGALAQNPYVMVLYEAPHRLRATLADALDQLGNRPAAIARELTKLHEQYVRGTLHELVEHFTTQAARGEIVVMITGNPKPVAAGSARMPGAQAAAADDVATPPDDAQIAARLRELRAANLSGTQAAKQVARELGADRQMVYRVWTTLDD